METLNRPTASSPSTNGHLAALSTRARRLWSERLDAEGDERDGLFISLNELDIALERLAIRSACDLIEAADSIEFERCRHQLDQLERRWQRSADATRKATVPKDLT